MNKRQFSVLREFVGEDEKGRCHDWLRPLYDDDGELIAPHSITLKAAQEETIDFLQGQEIFEGSKDKMIGTVQEAPTLLKLVQYLYNSLLQWEGFGTE